ncbi:MAG TPA: hypothetical protein VF834_16660 [Streptosporangiaceae bacterium]
MARNPALVTIRQRPFRCVVCGGRLFFDRELQLNTAGMEFLGMGWANQAAIGLVCTVCGYVHTFLNDTIEFWEPEDGYPRRGR